MHPVSFSAPGRPPPAAAATAGRYRRPLPPAATAGRHRRPLPPTATADRYRRPLPPTATADRYRHPFRDARCSRDCSGAASPLAAPTPPGLPDHRVVAYDERWASLPALEVAEAPGFLGAHGHRYRVLLEVGDRRREVIQEEGGQIAIDALADQNALNSDV